MPATGELNALQARRLRQLQREISRLKRLVMHAEPELAFLWEAANAIY